MYSGYALIRIFSFHFSLPGASTKIKAEDGRDPLFSAVEKRNIEIVKILLEHGANPNSRYDGTDLLSCVEVRY